MTVLSIPVYPFIIFGVLAVAIITVAIIAARKAMNELNDIRQNGICVDSVVCSCEEYTRDHKTRYRTKVRFTGPNGETEERELDYVGGMPVGRKVRIQYIPGKYQRVVFISQQIGSENT